MARYYVHRVAGEHSAELTDVNLDGWQFGITTTKRISPRITPSEFCALFAKEVDARKVCHELNNPETKPDA